MKNSPFYKQADLMLRVLPYVAREKYFALKGGTAINFFVRDMPRLSVDIDLTYLPDDPRNEAIKIIGESLERITRAIQNSIPQVRVQTNSISADNSVAKLFVRTPDAQIKIEPNPVIRGSVFPPVTRPISKEAEKLFELFLEVPTLSVADLYGGKICATLDRQHPRDLFDINLLLKNEGITEEIRKAFVVYIASHKRPMNELLDPVRKDISSLFKNEFSGMTSVSISSDELLKTRENLISMIKKELTDSERKFLLSVKEMNPRWDLLGIKGIENIPSIQWKIINLKKMDSKKHNEAIQKLKFKLGM